MKKYSFIWLMLLSLNLCAESLSQKPESIPVSTIQGFNTYPEKVKGIIQVGLDLANKNIGYRYSSSSPTLGGMDCSGTVYFILNSVGIKDVPRSSHTIYQWASEKGHFYPVTSNQLDSAQFAHLKPGDLLFWKGTYEVKHEPDVTHVMIYLGKNRAGKPLMLGASNGRTYKGRKIYGVSVFDFLLPPLENKSEFLGYACIPGINC